MVKVLVVGGAGYIGSHVVKALLQSGHRVTVYDNLSSGQKINLFSEAGFVEADILDFAALDKAMAGQEAVVHLAAKKAVGESMEKPELYAENNITGSLNIMKAMLKNGVENMVFSSSAAVYGMPEYLPIDEKHPLRPINFYGFTKYDIEKYMEWYGRLKNFRYLALRYFNAVGYDAEGSIRGREVGSQNLLPIIMDTAAGRREKLMVFGTDYDTRDGTCIRDYIHVTDLARAHVLAVEHLHEGGCSACLNLGTGRGLNVEYAGRRAGDPGMLTASSAEAEKLLGWRPEYTDIEEIIRTMWQLER